MFGLYLCGYVFHYLGLCSSLKNYSLWCLIGNYFWLSFLHNTILLLLCPKIHAVLTSKWSASTDSLQCLNKTYQCILQVTREVTCDSANPFKVFIGCFIKNLQLFKFLYHRDLSERLDQLLIQDFNIQILQRPWQKKYWLILFIR